MKEANFINACEILAKMNNGLVKLSHIIKLAHILEWINEKEKN